MTIGVFDSGIGGQAIAQSLQSAFSEVSILTVNDHKHLPYGLRPAEEIKELTDSAIQPLLRSGCDCIVIACNTATAVAIEWLREKYPSQKFIGLEPMIKPAIGLTKTGCITVCATPTTLGSNRYKSLKTKYAENCEVYEPDCSSWAKMIEDNDINEQHIRQTIELSLSKNSDVIVLACTHYHWIKDLIQETARDRAIVIDPSDAIVKRTAELLKLS